MVRYFIILCLTFFFSINAFSQFGLRAGINFSDQSVKNYPTTETVKAENKVGYLIGLNYNFKLTSSMGLRSGIEYSVKGADLVINTETLEYNIAYLEIPVEFVYDMGVIEVYGGPYMAFLTTAKEGLNNLKPDYETLDIGLNLGAEFKIGNIGLGAKYGLGINNISDYDNDVTTIKNNVLSIYALLSF